MSNIHLPPPCQGSNTTQTRPPLRLITNTAPSSDNDGKQNTQPPMEKLKTMKLRLPHPNNLNAPLSSSSSNKWSATSHPIKGLSLGYIGYHILYKHFYFHHGRILHTNAFAPSTTASTIGDGGNPRGSTELDDEIGANCAMSKDDHIIFASSGRHTWHETRQWLVCQYAA
jgi:hypothetical protein